MDKKKEIMGEKESLVMTVGIFVFIMAVVYLISLLMGGSLYSFYRNALPWLVMGVGMAFAVVLADGIDSQDGKE